MTNYSKNVDYAAKDALAHLDPNKLILGTALDAEFLEIQTVFPTKFEASDIASQAQAEAAASNAVLMTPLRVLNWANFNAGAVADIQALTDPNANRLLAWNDTNNAVEWLPYVSVSGSIDHDLLLNWVANKHIDHSTVSISAGVGLSGGGTIAATRTLTLDINGLVTDAAIDTAADFLPYYDTSEGAANKVLMSTMLGNTLGDGAFYSGGQALAAGVESTVVYGTTDYNTLTRGTYATGTGIYTAGASGARIQVHVISRVSSIAVAGTLIINGYQNATSKGYARGQNYADGTATELQVTCSFTVSLAAAETLTIKATASAAATLTAGQQYNKLSIVELA